ncbi:hypothetical protein B0H16DRAFT_1689078 [Mycena metata]|uniref:Uncharacterized protein n=1 Tax=Mycena metata TaxID=1033252 RepID=A0AAD7JAN1_9AGAR|nr:hypothetical protein B0H16DRAFT_1689078 [Mycena metata]
MPSLPDASLSILASPFSPATAAKIILAIISLVLIVASLYYVSPTRLTRILSDAMNNLDKIFVEVSVAGLLGLLSPDDVQTVVSTYQMLRVEVGKVQTETLRNSKSWCTSLFSVFAGGSVSLVRCIKKVKEFQRHLQTRPPTGVLQNKTPASGHRPFPLPPPPSNNNCLRSSNNHPSRKQNRARRPPCPIPSPTAAPSGSLTRGYHHQGGGGYPSPPPARDARVAPGTRDSESSSIYGAPMNALRQPEPPVAPKDHREQREPERDRDRKRDREREREQRERERERERAADAARTRAGQGPRATTAGTRPRPARIRTKLAAPVAAWQGGSPVPSAHGPPPLSQSQSQSAQVQAQQQQQHQRGPGVGWLGLGPGGACKRARAGSFTRPSSRCAPLSPPGSGSGSGGRKGFEYGGGGGGNAKTAKMLMRDVYGTRSPAIDKWEMDASNANNANANSSFNSGVVGGSTNTGAFSLGVGHLGVGIDTPRANASRAGSSVAAIHSSYQFCNMGSGAHRTNYSTCESKFKSFPLSKDGSRNAIMLLIGKNKLAVPAKAQGTISFTCSFGSSRPGVLTIYPEVIPHVGVPSRLQFFASPDGTAGDYDHTRIYPFNIFFA